MNIPNCNLLSFGATKHSKMGEERSYFPNRKQWIHWARGGDSSLPPSADMCQQASEGGGRAGGRGRLCSGAGSDMSCAHVHASSIKSCALTQARESEKGSGKIDRTGERRCGSLICGRISLKLLYRSRHRTHRIWHNTESKDICVWLLLCCNNAPWT